MAGGDICSFAGRPRGCRGSCRANATPFRDALLPLSASWRPFFVRAKSASLCLNKDGHTLSSQVVPARGLDKRCGWDRGPSTRSDVEKPPAAFPKRGLLVKAPLLEPGPPEELEASLPTVAVARQALCLPRRPGRCWLRCFSPASPQVRLLLVGLGRWGCSGAAVLRLWLDRLRAPHLPISDENADLGRRGIFGAEPCQLQ